MEVEVQRGGLEKHLMQKHSKEWFTYLSSLGVCEDFSVGASARGSNMVQSQLNTSNSSGLLTHRTYNKDRDCEILLK